jgi:beta-aspartyl-peptidase (threonine type)
LPQVLTAAGTIEMDAFIMDGATRAAGAVTLFSATANPISAARRVMDASPHLLLAGATANEHALRCGLPPVRWQDLVTDTRRQQLANALAAAAATTTGTAGGLPSLTAAALATKGTPANAAVAAAAAAASVAAEAPGAALASPAELDQRQQQQQHTADAGDHDTVGAVALDAHGNVAAATSTGGLTAKWAGRVGDTPLMGCGGFADNMLGACSTTGTGEYIIRFMLAREVLATYDRMGITAAGGSEGTARPVDPVDAGRGPASTAVAQTLAAMQARLGGPGAGLVMVTPAGDVGVGHSTHRMSWSYAVGTAPPAGVAQGQSLAYRFAAGVQLGEAAGAAAGVRTAMPPSSVVTEKLQ